MTFLEKVYDKSPIIFQNLMCTVSGYQKNKTRFGKAYWEYRDFLKEFDTWSYEKQKQYQLEELKKFLKYAVENSSYYKKLYASIDISSINTISDLNKLPIVDKEMLRQNMQEVMTVPARGSVEGHTGGLLENR